MYVRAVLLVICLALAAAWPLRDALAAGDAAGAGPDVVVTLWAMWWFAADSVGAFVYGKSQLVNHPFGTHGTVLAPLASLAFSLLRRAFGDAGAANALAILVLTCLAGGAAWIARSLGLGWLAITTAGLAMFAGRYPLYALGETSIVGLTAVPLVFGLGAWVRRQPAVLVLCAALTALEYPYLVPVLPCLALLRAARERSLRWGLVGGVALLLAFAGTQVIGRGQTLGFSVAGSAPIVFFAHLFPVIEEPQARSEWVNLLLPGPVVWSTNANGSFYAGGRDYLGLSLLSLGAFGGRRAWPWLGMAAIGVALALGSDWGGIPGPFAWLNIWAAHVVRALTQPTRFLILANVGLAVAAAFGIERLGRRAGLAGLAVVVIDALYAGGLSLRLPQTALPTATCVAALSDRHGVVVWPWDAQHDSEAGLKTRLWQLVHQQPGATFGVGSWTLGQGQRTDQRLRAKGFVLGEPIPTLALRLLDYDTLVYDTSASGPPPEGLKSIPRRCTGAVVYDLNLE